MNMDKCDKKKGIAFFNKLWKVHKSQTILPEFCFCRPVLLLSKWRLGINVYIVVVKVYKITFSLFIDEMSTTNA